MTDMGRRKVKILHRFKL